MHMLYTLLLQLELAQFVSVRVTGFSARHFDVLFVKTKVYNEQVNDEPGNYGAGFLGLRYHS